MGEGSVESRLDSTKWYTRGVWQTPSSIYLAGKSIPGFFPKPLKYHLLQAILASCKACRRITPILSSGGYSKYTPDDFTSDVRKFGLFVKDKKIGEIRTADIQQWIAELKKVLSAKTVSRKVAALSNYFLWLVAEGVFDHKTNPAGAIRYARVTSPLPDILFENECQALLQGVKQ